MKSLVRKQTGRFAIQLLVYGLLMYASAFLVAIFLSSDFLTATGEVREEILVEVLQSGISYWLAIFFAVFLFGWWKKGKDIYHELTTEKRKMTVTHFSQVFFVLMLAQLVATGFATSLEWLLNQIGYSSLPSVEATSEVTFNWMIYIHAVILAPVSEELIFRYTALSRFKEHGKVYAIVLSALFFGLFHGNAAQGIFAFIIGLVFGYLALEYSLQWAVAFHFINNIAFNVLLGILAQFVTEEKVELIWLCLLVLASSYMLFYCYRRRQDIRDYLNQNKWEGKRFRQNFLSIGFWLFIIFYIWQMISSITPL